MSNHLDLCQFLSSAPEGLLAALSKATPAQISAGVKDEAAQRQARRIDLESGVSVDDFLAEEHERLAAFRERWRTANAINPVIFPNVLPQENAGTWFEMVLDFNRDNPFPLPDPIGEPAPVIRKPSRGSRPG